MTSPPDSTAFRAVLDSVFAAPAYRWVDEPDVLATLRDWWYRLGEWLESLRTGNPVAFRLFVVALLVVLLLIIAHAAYVTYQAMRGAVQAPETSHSRHVPLLRDAAWYRREADRAAADGRLPEALQLAFAALALTLDAQGLLRYRGSMTPAECVRAARVSDTDRHRLRALVSTLYAHVFGGRPCAHEDYARWRDDSALPWHAAAH